MRHIPLLVKQLLNRVGDRGGLDMTICIQHLLRVGVVVGSSHAGIGPAAQSNHAGYRDADRQEELFAASGYHGVPRSSEDTSLRRHYALGVCGASRGRDEISIR